MAHREVGEEEVASRVWPVEIDQARYRSAGQDSRTAGFLWHSSLGDRARLLKCRKQKVVGVHGEGDVGLSTALALIDLELYDGRRVDRTTVRRCLFVSAGLVSLIVDQVVTYT